MRKIISSQIYYIFSLLISVCCIRHGIEIFKAAADDGVVTLPGRSRQKMRHPER